MDNPSELQAALCQPSQTRPQDSHQPFLPQRNSQDSGDRWKILVLICISSFGFSFADLYIFELGKMRQDKEFEWILPLVCGVMLSRYEIKRIYQSLAGISSVAVLLIVMSLEKEYGLYKVGASLFYAAYFGSFVAQISMITKLFKRREFSLALGAFHLSNSLAFPFLLELYLLHEGPKGPENLFFKSYIVAISCGAAIYAVLFMTKLYRKIQVREVVLQGKGQKSLSVALRSVKLITLVLMGAIIFYSSTDYFRIAYLPLRKAKIINATVTRILTFITLLSVFLSPLFGYLADKKGERITMMILSFFLLLIGNLVIFLFAPSQDGEFMILALVLKGIAGCLFQVSSWACLSLSVPKRSRGIVLGLTFAVLSMHPRWPESFETCLISCILGMVVVGFGWVLSWKKKGNLDSLVMESSEDIIKNVDLT